METYDTNSQLELMVHLWSFVFIPPAQHHSLIQVALMHLCVFELRGVLVEI